MTFRPYNLIEPVVLLPLVVDSPHSGRIYPADFAYTCPHSMLRQTEDSYVDELIAGAVEAGATVIAAEFPRSYIDANRAENDIDPAVLAEPWSEPLAPSERTRQGLGLVRRLCRSGVPVYRNPLLATEIRKRITQCYRPYHEALQKILAARQEIFGVSYLIDCHSMPNYFERGDRPHADFVLGDRDGTACDPSFTRRVRDILLEQGFSVTLNDPFKGMEIVRRHGQPQAGRHALQLEINRKLYMNEDTLEKHEGFVKLQRSLTRFFQTLASDLMREMPDRLAAE
jgi:N-formylglutamate amidohydrolase